MRAFFSFLALISTPVLADLQDDPQAPPQTQDIAPPPASRPQTPAREETFDGTKAKAPAGKKVKKSPPVVFRSETMSGNRFQGHLVLKGSVKITQGDLIMMSDEAVIDQDIRLGTLKTIVATGNVYFQRMDEATGKKMTATSQSATYLAQAKTITFKGNASITRGTDKINGTIFTYDIASGLIKAQKVDGVFEQNE